MSLRVRDLPTPKPPRPAREVSDLEAAEAGLRLQAKLIEHVTDSIIATDVEGRVTSWNPAAGALYGWTAAEAIGQVADELLGDPAHGVGIDSLPRASRAEVTLRHRDGSAVHVVASVADIRDSAGAVTGRVMISSDVGEGRKAEQIRQQADARYSAAVAALDEGVVIVGVDDSVEAANPAALAMLGCPALIGSVFGETITLFDELGDPIAAERSRARGGARHGFGPAGLHWCGPA